MTANSYTLVDQFVFISTMYDARIKIEYYMRVINVYVCEHVRSFTINKAAPIRILKVTWTIRYRFDLWSRNCLVAALVYSSRPVHTSWFCPGSMIFSDRRVSFRSYRTRPYGSTEMLQCLIWWHNPTAVCHRSKSEWRSINTIWSFFFFFNST